MSDTFETLALTVTPAQAPKEKLRSAKLHTPENDRRIRKRATMRRMFAISIVVAATLCGGNAFASARAVVNWAFPSEGASAAAAMPPTAIVVLPGSSSIYRQSVIDDGFLAIDWWPNSHPAMPHAVRFGVHRNALACGYCHLPDGQGRPENAALAGLSAAYITAQVMAMKHGAREAERANWGPAMYMHQTALAVTPSDLARAAAYFSRLHFSARTHVVEATTIPAVAADAFVYRRLPRGTELLGQRIVETPDNFERFEKRDSTITYTAYVPRGSIELGRLLATTGDNGRVPACAACHGAGLHGVGDTPPLAGRSPTMLFRQLEAFRGGTRHAAADEPMRVEVAQLTSTDFIDLAAFIASLSP
jgi:cytochrome c553